MYTEERSYGEVFQIPRIGVVKFSCTGIPRRSLHTALMSPILIVTTVKYLLQARKNCIDSETKNEGNKKKKNGFHFVAVEKQGKKSYLRDLAKKWICNQGRLYR